MIDLIVTILAVLALLGMITIVTRKFPTLAAIDTRVIPAERHGELKTKLIEQRMKRKLLTFIGLLFERFKPAGARISAFLRSRYHKLIELERRYRSRVDKTTDLSPAELEKKGQRLETLLAQADDALRREEYNLAESAAIELVSADPRNVQAFRVLAAVYLARKEFEQARETLQFIVERLHVEDDELYAELGQVATGEGKFEEAKRDLEKSIVLNGQVAQHHLDLCRVNLSLGDSTAAFEHCRSAVELEPNNPKFLDALVETSIVVGKKEWAQDAYKKLRAVNPENQKLSEFAGRIENMRVELPRPTSRSRSLK